MKAAFPTIASPTLEHCQIRALRPGTVLEAGQLCPPRSWLHPCSFAALRLHVGVELGSALQCLPASSPCPRVSSHPCTAAGA